MLEGLEFYFGGYAWVDLPNSVFLSLPLVCMCTRARVCVCAMHAHTCAHICPLATLTFTLSATMDLNDL